MNKLKRRHDYIIAEHMNGPGQHPGLLICNANNSICLSKGMNSMRVFVTGMYKASEGISYINMKNIRNEVVEGLSCLKLCMMNCQKEKRNRT